MMSIVLRGLHKFTGNLSDDILVFSKDFDSHLKHVDEVLKRLREAGLTVNTKKCKFEANSLSLFWNIN